MKDFLDGYYENQFLRLVRQNSTTLGLEVNGSSISNSYTLATLPDATAVEVGTIINIPRSEFTTSTAATVPGMPEDGIYLRASDGIWIPDGEQVFSEVWSTKASPLATVSTASATAVAVTLPSGMPIIPTELYAYVGFKCRIEFDWGCSAAAASGGGNIIARFGSDIVTRTNNPVIGFGHPIPASIANARQSFTIGRARIMAYASAASNTMTLSRLVSNYSTLITADNGYSDYSNLLDFTEDAYLQFHYEPSGTGATDWTFFGYKFVIGDR